MLFGSFEKLEPEKGLATSLLKRQNLHPQSQICIPDQSHSLLSDNQAASNVDSRRFCLFQLNRGQYSAKRLFLLKWQKFKYITELIVYK